MAKECQCGGISRHWLLKSQWWQ